MLILCLSLWKLAILEDNYDVLTVVFWESLQVTFDVNHHPDAFWFFLFHSFSRKQLFLYFDFDGRSPVLKKPYEVEE